MRNVRPGTGVGSLVPALALSLCGGCLAWNLNSGKTLPLETSALTVGFNLLEIDGELFAFPLFGYRYSPAERWEVGVGVQSLFLTMDGRYQILVDERHGLDSAIEFGVGSYLGAMFFGGIVLSKDLGEITPYLHYRYLRMATLTPLWQFTPKFSEDTEELSFGLEIRASSKFAVIPEIVWIPDLEDGVPFFLNVAFRVSQ